jgi:glutaminase
LLFPPGSESDVVADSLMSPVERYLHALHERFREVDDGTVASYIPELAKADPRWFGISIATVDGHVYEIGDTRQPFTIQSISKPFVYGLVLEDRGKETVLGRIGVEPTGDAFNEISLEQSSGRPFNPMINAGAIASTALVAGHSAADRWSRILALFSIYAGRSLDVDEVVYGCERDTGHRNRAISHLLRNFGIIEDDPEPSLDLYFRQCSILVTCRDLAVMGATLATGGTNPITRERAIRSANVNEVLSVMTTCGMYDYAGEWLYRVGLPAKSGVAGGLLAVLPGQLGIGIYSPPLDARGNTVRGVAVCKALSDELELHFLRAPRAAVSALRSRSTLQGVSSKRIRSERQRALLQEHGGRAIVYQLQGDLTFAGIEVAIRKLVAEGDYPSHFVIDLTRATDVDPPAARMVLELLRRLNAQGRALAFVGMRLHGRLQRFLEETRARDAGLQLLDFEDLDAALEWSENAVLTTLAAGEEAQEEIPLARHDFLQGVAADEIALLEATLERREFHTRQLVVRKDDPADALYLLVKGRLSVIVDTPQGRLQRLSTLSPGMGFGEASLVEGAKRTATVRADEPSVCWVLQGETYRAFGASHPALKITLLENILRATTRILGRMNVEALGNGL